MKNESKTLFIPLYGKALMSREGFLKDPAAEQIAASHPHLFRSVDTSKKLAIYMAMRAMQYDAMTEQFLRKHPDTLVLHLGCGLDSRYCRVRRRPKLWVDLDYPEVIALRRHYYKETENYRMLASSVTALIWLDAIPYHGEPVLVLAEGLSMYLTAEEMKALFRSIRQKFDHALFLFDAYSAAAAALSRWINPINAMDAKIAFAMDDPAILENRTHGIKCICSRDIILPEYIDRLHGAYKYRFRFMSRFGSGFYRIYGYRFQKRSGGNL